METIGPSKFLWLNFDKAGGLEDPGAERALLAAISDPQIQDLVVISHGWKNDQNAAWRLYSELWPNVCAKLSRDPATILVAGVTWPAKRYNPEADEQAVQATAADAGGVLSAADGSEPTDLDDAAFETVLAEALELLQPEDPALLRTAAMAYVVSGDARSAEALFMEARVAADAAPDGDDELDPEAIAIEQAAHDAAGALATLGGVAPLKLDIEVGSALDLGEDIASWFKGRKAAVMRLLEQLSYYQMKKRAGTVGAELGLLLGRIDPPRGIRLHLIGHSFGARLVTSAANSLNSEGRLTLFSLTLLQGAFSHNALSQQRGGAFHRVVGRPEGPVAITHTHNDRACTFIYALASRLARDNTLAVGDRNDPYGSMGANGAQFVTAAAFDGSSGFNPRKGVITNFKADAYIRDPEDAHGDVRNAAVGALVASVIEA
jgi:hypothetical protein